MQAKRIRTRQILLESAHALMSEKGVDGTTILEITDRAGVGFGTFYNYFESKDDIAAAVLDCVIDSLGRRNDLANEASQITDPRQIIIQSVQAVGREMRQERMWHWWLKRPDLLIDRMREGFRKYAERDIARVKETEPNLTMETSSIWSMLIWLLVGRVTDMVHGARDAENDRDLTEAIARMLGAPPREAQRLADSPVFPLPEEPIDFSFRCISKTGADAA